MDYLEKQKEIVGYVESELWLNGVFKGKEKTPIYKVAENVGDNDAIGIGVVNPFYIETNELQDKDYEYKKIKKFLRLYVAEYAKKNGLEESQLKLEFINYGKTQLVYVLTEPNGKRVTILTKQPAVEFGKVRQEAENLKFLNTLDKNVIAPIDYFKFGDQELYVTPYMHQARCVAHDGISWGMYIPEPFYRFKNFNKAQKEIVTTCMIAKLVSYYNFKTNEGIAACKFGGGDFMLPKGWENNMPTLSNTYKNLHFIAAREKIKCSFNQYLEIIRDEFSRPTINEAQSNLKINHRARGFIDESSIEKGIMLGKKILEKRQSSVEN